jgi:hypothetical protein
MGFSSWKCAVSLQSIPADCVEPTSVTLFLPDGRKLTGIYDGYGRLLTGDGPRFQSINALFRSIAADAGIELPKGQVEAFNWPKDTLDAVHAAFQKAYPGGSPYDVMKGPFIAIYDEVSKCIEPLLAASKEQFATVMNHTKLVKTKYVTDSMTYASLPASPLCPEQGYFYKRSGSWNRPEYPRPARARQARPRG